MNFAEITIRRQEIKDALVEAHRNQDWERARELSQEKQRLRKPDRTPKPCEFFGCNAITTGRWCPMHLPTRVSMKGQHGPKLEGVDGLGPVPDPQPTIKRPATDLQKRVIRHWLKTGSMDETAGALEISQKTVWYHLDMLRRQLGIKNLTLLAVWGTRNGFAPR